MRTKLSDAMRERFLAIPVEIVPKIWTGIVRQDPTIKVVPGPPTDGDELFDCCRAFDVDLARVVLTIAGACDAVGRAAIEALMGKPIPPHPEPGTFWFAFRADRPRLSPPAEPRQAGGSAAAEGDARVVKWIKMPPPRKSGSEAGEAYLKWRVGATVGQLRAEGLPQRSIRRDVRDGYVTFEEETPSAVDAS